MRIERRDLLKLAAAGGFASLLSYIGIRLFPSSYAAYESASMMEKRRLGRTGIHVSVIGFGGATLRSFSQVRVVAEALKMGVNFIDTAYTYGGGVSEMVVGEAVRSFEGDVYVATKTSRRDREGAEAQIRESIRRLGTGKADIVYMHAIGTMNDLEKATDTVYGALAAVERLRGEGLVKYVGISGAHSPIDLPFKVKVERQLKVMAAAVDSGVFDVIQVSYHIEFPEVEEVIDRAYEQDVGVVCKKPLGAGKLIPKYGVEKLLKFVIGNPRVSAAIPGMANIDQVREDVPVGYKHES